MMALPEDSYEKEKKYVREKLEGGHTIARNNPHVYTLFEAARKGVKSVQSFIAATELESHLH